MPHPFPLASIFSSGMRRDVDRTELPGGSAYNLIDFIPDEIQAVTGGRGGWQYSAGAMSGATQIQVIGWHPIAGKLVAVDQAKALWDVQNAVTIGSFAADLGAIPIAPPAYHRGYLIFPSGDGTSVPGYYKSDGTTGTLAGAPTGTRAGVYKDHAILANSTANTNRIWFSAAGDPTTWDTTYGWWDTTGAVIGVAPLLNAILVFHTDSTERLRGTTPPPGSDFVLEPFLPSTGCIDVNSVAYWQNRVVWCSQQGIHMSDGASMVDLTEAAQMKTYWQSLMTNYASSWRIAAGIYRDHYIVSINNGSTLVDCLCVSLTNQTMWRFSNIHGASFVNIQYGSREILRMGQWNGGRVLTLEQLWSPSATYNHDGDGTKMTPTVETGMFRGFDRLHRRWIESMGKQKWRWAYVDYDLRSTPPDADPAMTLSYCTTPTGAYLPTASTLPATTTISRVRRSLSPTQGGATHSQMLGLKLAVTGSYALANLYTIEGAFEPIEIGAL